MEKVKKEVTTVVRLPQEIHQQLKVKVAKDSTTIKDYVTTLIVNDLKKDGELNV